MKKITFRRCTVMAAVFAACLFAAGCKPPSAQTPPPNPEPAPAPTPTPPSQNSGGASSSISVQPPAASSVTPGASVQEIAIPNPNPAVETELIKVELKSIAMPKATDTGVTHGVAVTLPAESATTRHVYVTIPVPKSKVNNTLERAAEMRRLLLLKLKADGLGNCKLYKTAAPVTPATAIDPADGITNFKKDGSGVVYVGAERARIKVTALNDAGLLDDGTHGVETVTLAEVTQRVDGASAAEPKTTMTKAEITAITEKKLEFEVWNTDTIVQRRAAVEGVVKGFFNEKFSASPNEYELYNNATPAAAVVADFTAAGGGSGAFVFGATGSNAAARKVYFAVKKRTLGLCVTVKPITREKVKYDDGGTKKYCEPTDDLSGTVYTYKKASGTDNLDNCLTDTVIMQAIEANLNQILGRGTPSTDYIFFTTAEPTDATSGGTNPGGKLDTANDRYAHNMIIYIAKKTN